MLKVRQSHERGCSKTTRGLAYFSFSFDQYQDARFNNFCSMRVLNEDFIDPNQGFPSHSHANMEILTYMISGKLAHKDNLGNSFILNAGDTQLMQAGSGITHSEFNPTDNEISHLLQIWFYPLTNNIQPSYQQKHFSHKDKYNKLCKIVDYEVGDNSLNINQKVKVFASISKNITIQYPILTGHKIWIHLACGKLQINNITLTAGDGIGIEEEAMINLIAKDEVEAEFILMDFA